LAAAALDLDTKVSLVLREEPAVRKILFAVLITGVTNAVGLMIPAVKVISAGKAIFVAQIVCAIFVV